jgi:hypothetical protein
MPQIHKFVIDKELKKSVPAWLTSQPNFFSPGIHTLVHLWTKCIDKQVDYVEKWYSHTFSVAVALI